MCNCDIIYCICLFATENFEQHVFNIGEISGLYVAKIEKDNMYINLNLYIYMPLEENLFKYIKVARLFKRLTTMFKQATLFPSFLAAGRILKLMDCGHKS